MTQTAPYILHGADVSYFTGKVRPAFAHKTLWMREVMPDILEIKRRTGLHYFPAVETPEGEIWQDTSDILDRLEARIPSPPLFPTSPLQRIAAYLMELYADEFMLLPGLHYRWAFPESAEHARQGFAASSGNFAASTVFADTIEKQFAPMVGATPETGPVLEAHVSDLLAALESHFAEHRFLLGDAPSLADCSLMGPFYGHFYLDPVPARLLKREAPNVCHWIETMNHPNQDDFGEWLEGEPLSAQMQTILGLIGADAIPLLLDTAAAVDAWADEHAVPGETPPRVLGMHTTTLRGLTFTRYTSPYTVWMIQRPLDAYRALEPANRERVDEALRGTGCEALFERPPRHRLGKSGIALVVASS